MKYINKISVLLLLIVTSFSNVQAQWTTWNKYPNNYVYEHNTEGAWNVASDPAVIFEDSIYRMIVSGDRGTMANGTGDGNSIIMATSLDGYVWTTLQNGQNGVVVQGFDGDWDESMELPELIKYGNKYKIFYCGYDPAVRDSTGGLAWGDLGISESTDGVNFVKQNLLVMSRTQNWYDQDGITDPTIVEQNDTLFMTYIGWCTQNCTMNGGSPAFYSLKAISVDSGYTWIKKGQLDANGVIYQHPDLELNPDGTYSIFYNEDGICTGGKTGINQAIGPTPFGPFTPVTNNPIFCLGTQTFEHSGLDGGFPSIINDNGTAKLYYTGVDEINQFYRIGLVESNTIVSIIENPNSNNKIQVFPNPATNKITVQGNLEELEKITLYNFLGQDASNFVNIIHSSHRDAIIDISNLNSGIYFLKTKTTTNKVYKQ